MPYEIPKIDSVLFHTTEIKKVREVTPRPEDRRSHRDTYSESDEVNLNDERNHLVKNKEQSEDPGTHKKETQPHRAHKKEEEKINSNQAEKPEEKKDGLVKHVNVVV